MHHGKIEVESTVGEGTKFILSLPLGNRHFSDEEMAVTEGRESLIIPGNFCIFLWTVDGGRDKRI